MESEVIKMWLSSHEAALGESISERTVRRRARQGNYGSENSGYRYVNGIGRGGQVLQIALESLSDEVQARYRGEQLNFDDEIEQEILSLTQEQRELFFERLAAVRGYKEFKKSYYRADKQRAYLRQYNSEHPDRAISKRQLNHWEKKYDRDGIAGLIDRRGAWNKGVSSIPDDVKEVFLAYWLQEKGTATGGPSIASCYRLTQMAFPGQQLPNISSFKRLAKSIPEPARVLAQKGKKAYHDKFEPYIPRNYESIHTNQIWVLDNHLSDVLVSFPDGHVGRPWIIGIEDMSSRYLVGFYIIDGEPNSDYLLDAFITAVGEYGIPETVQTDNGKDYVVHDLFDRDNAYSLANEMSMSVTRAIKYNAKAKNIERAFGTIEYSWLIHLPSYIGANPKNRPAELSKLNSKLGDVAISFDEFKQTMAWVVERYNNTPHSGHGMNGRTPKQAFEGNITVPLKIASQELLSVYFQRRTKLLKVGRNGIRIPALEQYYDDNQLFPYIGQKIYARYKTDDVRYVYCYTEEGRFICTAASVQLGEMNQELSAQQMRELNTKKKARFKMVKELLPHSHAPSIQELAIEGGGSFNRPDLRLLPSVIAIDPEKQNEAAQIRAEEVRQNENQRPELANPANYSALDSEAINEALAERFNIG